MSSRKNIFDFISYYIFAYLLIKTHYEAIMYVRLGTAWSMVPWNSVVLNFFQNTSSRLVTGNADFVALDPRVRFLSLSPVSWLPTYSIGENVVYCHKSWGLILRVILFSIRACICICNICLPEFGKGQSKSPVLASLIKMTPLPSFLNFQLFLYT